MPFVLPAAERITAVLRGQSGVYKRLSENAAISMGYLATLAPVALAPHADQFLGQWCVAWRTRTCVRVAHDLPRLPRMHVNALLRHAESCLSWSMRARRERKLFCMPISARDVGFGHQAQRPGSSAVPYSRISGRVRAPCRCNMLRQVRDGPEKEAAFVGLLAMLSCNPQSGLACFSSLCHAVGSWAAPPPALECMLRDMMHSYKAQLESAGQWTPALEAVARACSPSLVDRITAAYAL